MNEPIDRRARTNSLVLIGIAFFCWGMLRSLNDVLVVVRQRSRMGHDAAAMLVHFSFFAAYLLLPIPVSLLLRRLSFKVCLAVATGLMSVGALLCATGLHYGQWGLGLGALFGVAAGIAILQTSGNPAVSLLGPKHTVARRLLIVQSFSSLGSALAPTYFAVNVGTALTVSLMVLKLQSIYLMIGILLALLVLGFLAVLRGELGRPASGLLIRGEQVGTGLGVRRSLVFAVLSVFLFVGTEATVLTHIVQYRSSYLSGPAAFVWIGTLSVYWLLVMAGRAFGSVGLSRIGMISLLRAAGLGGAALVALGMLFENDAGSAALLSTGLTNALIFPLIYSISTENLNERELATASGWLMTAISGGAVLPLLSGEIADHVGLRTAFALPLLSYMWIALTARQCSAEVRLRDQ